MLWLLFTALVAVAAWPVLRQADRVLVGDDPDVYINPWADWWTLKALRDPSLTLWNTEHLFYPQGANLSYHSFSHLNTLSSLALRPLLGRLPAYNVAILVNYVLSGLAMTHLARYLTCSTAAAVLAGIVFAFNSHNLYQSAHPVLVSVWCFPWATLCFLRAARQNSRGWAVAAALFVFLGAASSTVLLIMMALWFALLVAYLARSAAWPRPSWGVLLTFGGLSGALALPLVWPLLSDLYATRQANFAAVPVADLSNDLTSFVVPHWLFWPQYGLYAGIVPFYLLLLAWGNRRRQVWPWLLLMGFSWLMAIGPRPYFLGRPLDVILPWTQPLVPFLRDTARLNTFISLGLAMAAAYGWTVVAGQLKGERGTRLAAAVAALAIFGDYLGASFPYLPAQVSPFYTDYLNGVPDTAALAILPTGRQADKPHMYEQTYHGQPITGGVISRSGGEVLAFIEGNPLLRAGAIDWPRAPLADELRPALDELNRAGVAFVVLDKTMLAAEEWQAVFDPLRPVYEDEWVAAYSTASP